MSIVRLSAAALVAMSMAACSANPMTGTGPKENTGTIAGAAIGGVIGNRIGAGMDEDDKRRAYAAQMKALDTGLSGSAVPWRNPDSGRYGNVMPGPAYQSNGQQCRQYTHTIYIDGKPQVARGSACRNADGTWIAVS